ncbi:MAG: hypothetical protein U2P59_02460 [Synergistota bacterium]|nr:hypothetical protein [Synergistota bacterium]
MKKKISRIQRWLDRLSTACETGRWDSALVEADCLSAEVRQIREDLTQKLENDHVAAASIFSRSAVTMSIKSVGIALFIVLVSTIPLAVESERPWTAQTETKPAQKNGDEILAWVTREEDELLRTLRSDLSGQNAGVTQTENVFSAPVKKRASAQVKRENVVVSEIPAVRNTPVRSEAEISAEDLMALLQIGEKALRGDTPAIKVIK